MATPTPRSPSPSPRRARRPQARALATRRKLLDAAERCLIRAGYEATSMAEIAERAGVGVGTLYHHFPDKRALLLALVDDWGDRELSRDTLGAETERLVGPQARQAIHEVLAARYAWLRSHGGFHLVLLELADRDHDVRQRLHRIQRVGIERLRALIAEGQRRGTMRAGVDALAAAFLIHHALESMATEVFVHRVSEPPPEQVLGELAEMICRYILEESR